MLETIHVSRNIILILISFFTLFSCDPSTESVYWVLYSHHAEPRDSSYLELVRDGNHYNYKMDSAGLLVTAIDITFNYSDRFLKMNGEVCELKDSLSFKLENSEVEVFKYYFDGREMDDKQFVYICDEYGLLGFYSDSGGFHTLITNNNRRGLLKQLQIDTTGFMEEY